MQQEIFSFHKIERFDWKDFVVSEENFDAISQLAKWPNWSDNGMIIHGASGTGKTHLAALWAQTANAVYIIKENLSHPRDLFGAECNFVIDNFEDFLNLKKSDWMFHFFNIAKEKNRFFLILSRLHPSFLNIELRDLESRLLSLPIVGIDTPRDDLLLKISQKIAHDLEIVVADDVMMYILNIIDRKTSSIIDVLKTLDKLSLQQKKPISLSFVKNYLKASNSGIDN
jgi:chromosomal replication initiation ATPase DnaA